MADETTPGGPSETASEPDRRALERRLAEVLSRLQIDQGVVLEKIDGGAYVQFGRWPGKLVAEAVSNRYLAGADRLDEGQVARLIAMNWSLPGETYEDDKGHFRGAPNFY